MFVLIGTVLLTLSEVPGTRDATIIRHRRGPDVGVVQIVMEGFLRFSLPPWQRRMVTRLVAMVPATIVAGVFGSRGAGKLLVLSQVRPAPPPPRGGGLGMTTRPHA